MHLVRQSFFGLLRALGLYHPLRDARRDRQFRERGAALVRSWQARGRPAPPPDIIKYGCIHQLAGQYGTPILVETGTFYGNALFTLRRVFRELHSIELAPALHAEAKLQFAHLRHIHLHLGDSTTELPKIAATLAAPTLYWLDGHFCAGPSARGAKDTPVFEELDFLLNRPARQDVVLIDDARLFTGADGYPTIDALRQMVAAKRPDARFEVADDIIRIVPV